jgi:hypothetical protein
MKKSSTLFYLVDNRNLYPSQLVNTDVFYKEIDDILSRLFEEKELVAPAELVQKTLNRVRESFEF